MGSVVGKPAVKKLLTALVRSGNDDFLRGLVVGMWRGDGYVRKYARVAGYVSVSAELTYQLCEVLSGLGVAFGVQKTDKGPPSVLASGKMICSRDGCYVVRVSGNSYEKLSDILGVSAHSAGRTVRGRSIITSRGVECHVKIGSEIYTGVVCNLEVEEDNSYTVNGVAVHNCCHMVDHRVWDSPDEPWRFDGLWRIQHSQSLPEEPKWECPSPNPFNLAELRRAYIDSKV